MTPCIDFDLAIVEGLGCKKWLKNGAEKCLYFMQLLQHYILFGKIFKLKYLYIQYAWISIMKK